MPSSIYRQTYTPAPARHVPLWLLRVWRWL
ncbi:hypothetical protein HNP55_003198 [Paucibacter oligotrophus]|uniref:Uncharacterized protein n=1 Tax=Roseateles oligotrophus TaxID=1769250 RepID=A0A840L7W5_9BURK|nr:hypothetical protein [Roseateles oligotrophus]